MQRLPKSFSASRCGSDLVCNGANSGAVARTVVGRVQVIAATARAPVAPWTYIYAAVVELTARVVTTEPGQCPSQANIRSRPGTAR